MLIYINDHSAQMQIIKNVEYKSNSFCHYQTVKYYKDQFTREKFINKIYNDEYMLENICYYS